MTTEILNTLTHTHKSFVFIQYFSQLKLIINYSNIEVNLIKYIFCAYTKVCDFGALNCEQ